MLYKFTPSHILYKIIVDHDLHIPFLFVFSKPILLTKYESNSRFVYFKYQHQFRKKPIFSKIAHIIPQKCYFFQFSKMKLHYNDATLPLFSNLSIFCQIYSILMSFFWSPVLNIFRRWYYSGEK